ncbi:MAG: hypothetical protein NTW13_02085, partial [Candidatus Omnitrophica bacterium]|nr:hypothetical protein [Candidatus Omnitrophota bacterium]
MRIPLIFVLVLFLSSCAHQVRTYDKKVNHDLKPAEIEASIKSIQLGERLVYAVDWIGIPSGYITLEVKEVAVIDGRPAYHLEARALPNNFFKF